MAYTGRDGLRHQETILDWDKTTATKVSTYPVLSIKERESLEKSLKEYHKELFNRFLAINPALAGEQYEQYVIRDFDKKELRWDVDVLKGIFDSSSPYQTNFFTIAVPFLEKRQEAFDNNQLSLKTPQVNR